MSQPLSLQVINSDTEFFSTPPSTPVVVGQPMHIPESRRNNSTRPSPEIDPGRSGWNPDIELSTTSPPLTKTNGIQTALLMTQDPTIVQVPTSVTPPSDSQNHKPAHSPCFVHSHLDKGTLLSDWLRNKHHHVVESSDVGVAKSLQHLTSPPQSHFKSGHDNNDENEFIGSLTKQLADTAVGVREMSKQLGTFFPLFQHYILITL